MNLGGIKKLVCAAALLTAISSPASAYSNVFVFGDSLSDNGNLQALDPRAPARFTNGPVAAEVVAGTLGFKLAPSYHLSGAVLGNNFAVAGAKAVDADGNEMTPDINLPTQVNAFLRSRAGVVPADALYIVLVGGNDIRAARGIRAQGILAATSEEAEAAREAAREYLRTAVASEQAQIAKLIAAGARKVLVVNTPDIGAIPETDLAVLQLGALAESDKQDRKAGRLPDVATKLSAEYNRMLAREVKHLEHQTGVDIMEFDLFAFLSEQIEAAEDFGYTNVDDACIYVFSQNGAVNPACADFPVASGFLFWDEIHPSARAHQGAAVAIVEMLLAQ